MKALNKAKFETCGKFFLFSLERYMKGHATKMHKADESPVPRAKTCKNYKRSLQQNGT